MANTKKQLTAVILRIILTSILILLIATAIGVFIFGYQQLQESGRLAAEASAEASASNDELRELVAIEARLKKDQQVVERASQIVADSKSYQYQDQIITDLNNFANKAGLTITNINFSTDSTPTQSGSSATAPATASSGLKSTTATITLASPTRYRSLMTFAKLIEESLTRMRISSLSLSRDQSAGSDNVQVGTISVEVYVR